MNKLELIPALSTSPLAHTTRLPFATPLKQQDTPFHERLSFSKAERKRSILTMAHLKTKQQVRAAAKAGVDMARCLQSPCHTAKDRS